MSENLALQQKLVDRSAAVRVIGLGYVGCAVAVALAYAGYSVIGIERDPPKITAINEGRYPLHGREPELPELLHHVVASGMLRATADYAVCRSADVILVCVETPVDEASRRPGYQALRNVLTALTGNLRLGTLLCFESTMAPGTTRDFIVPQLEQATGFSGQGELLVVCCPERVMPGKLLQNLRTYGRVIGGYTAAAAEVARYLYQQVTEGPLWLTDSTTAELVKTTENTYRDVQIAFANEIALLCEQYGADVYEVRDLVRNGALRDMHLPGAGVGGHCIPKDPWLLIAGLSETQPPLARLVPAARAVNDGMPAHVADLTEAALAEQGIVLAQARIAVLGFAYLENSDDTRNSPSAELVRLLQERGASHVRVHDPLVVEYASDLSETLRDQDCAVVMVAHDEYRRLDPPMFVTLMRTPILVDGRRVFDPGLLRRSGLTFRSVGYGEGSGATVRGALSVSYQRHSSVDG